MFSDHRRTKSTGNGVLSNSTCTPMPASAMLSHFFKVIAIGIWVCHNINFPAHLGLVRYLFIYILITKFTNCVWCYWFSIGKWISNNREIKELLHFCHFLLILQQIPTDSCICLSLFSKSDFFLIIQLLHLGNTHWQ